MFMYLLSLPKYHRVATHSGNFQVIENLRETQGILILFFKLKKTQGSFDFF